MALVAAAACSAPAGTGHGAVLRAIVTPDAPVVGRPSTVQIELRPEVASSWRGARLSLEAHMSHPGMAPVVIVLDEAAGAMYRGSLSFTMAGEWVLFVSGEARDGRQLREPVGRPIHVTP